LFFARQIKDKTGSAATRKKALVRKKVKTDSNHVPTSVDTYNDGALEEWFNHRDLATDLQLSLNKNRLASIMGSNFCDHTKLGFKDAAALEKAHKAVDLKYLRQANRMSVLIFHDTVFEHPTKETAARTKLRTILQNNEVPKIFPVPGRSPLFALLRVACHCWGLTRGCLRASPGGRPRAVAASRGRPPVDARRRLCAGS
jgi:hypothetical protein